MNYLKTLAISLGSVLLPELLPFIHALSSLRKGALQEKGALN